MCVFGPPFPVVPWGGGYLRRYISGSAVVARAGRSIGGKATASDAGRRDSLADRRGNAEPAVPRLHQSHLTGLVPFRASWPAALSDQAPRASEASKDRGDIGVVVLAHSHVCCRPCPHPWVCSLPGWRPAGSIDLFPQQLTEPHNTIQYWHCTEVRCRTTFSRGTEGGGGASTIYPRWRCRGACRP
jgi:hypothetical protein